MEKFDRLLREQQLAIEQTDAKILQLQKYTDDFLQLKLKLESLSRCFTKTAIIPFSSRAVVPAELIHTNEILVHLGGNAEHFCEVTTFQAQSIIDRRISRINADVKRLQDQRKLLADRESYTKKISKGDAPAVLGQSSCDTECTEKEFEIREEYDEQTEEEWLANHKKFVEAERKKQASSTSHPKHKRSVKFACDESSDSSFFSDIIFSHTNTPTRPVHEDIQDWSQASPADVVAHVIKRGVLGACVDPEVEPFSTCSLNEKPTVHKALNNYRYRSQNKPFSDVVERGVSESKVSKNREVDESRRVVSRFQAQRKQKQR